MKTEGVFIYTQPTLTIQPLFFFCRTSHISNRDINIFTQQWQTANIPKSRNFMAAIPKSATILERCRVAPPADGGAAAEQTLPLTFFDLIWLHFHPIQRLLFYQFTCSNTHFLEKIVPNFKKSLSQTLKHFFPLAGSLLYPLDPETAPPHLRYVPGDSVTVTVAESNAAHDFDYLTGNHPRVADEFYAFFPDLPPPETEPESSFRKFPLFAVQITLFPDTGICIGFNNNHCVGDASSVVGFIKAWSSIANLEDDREFLAKSDSIPIYDRSVINDPSGLSDIYWNQMKHAIVASLPLKFPINKVRSTFILQKQDIQKLRNFIQAKNRALTHLSSFTITAAYVWTCLAKSAAESGEEVSDDEPEYFAFAVDARQRTDPPVPAAYFGNCVGLAIAEAAHSQLKGDDGFLTAAELIGDVVSKKVNDKQKFMSDADQWLTKVGAIISKRIFGVAGSPKFDLYDTDFGWGKPKKYEAVAIDGDGSMSLCKSREFEGGLEIGLSLPTKKMDCFKAVFSDGLKI